MTIDEAVAQIKAHNQQLTKIYNLLNNLEYSTCPEIDAVNDFVESLEIYALKIFGDEEAMKIAKPILDLLDKVIPDCENQYLAQRKAEYDEEVQAKWEQNADYYASR